MDQLAYQPTVYYGPHFLNFINPEQQDLILKGSYRDKRITTEMFWIPLKHFNRPTVQMYMPFETFQNVCKTTFFEAFHFWFLVHRVPFWISVSLLFWAAARVYSPLLPTSWPPPAKSQGLATTRARFFASTEQQSGEVQGEVGVGDLGS